MYLTQLISQLSRLFLFLPIFLFAYKNLFTYPNDFEIITSKDGYKLILKNQHYIEYSDFKFFIPNFTKEFNLKVLRYNSVGYINGLIFMKKNYKLLDTQNELKYYLTDYKTTFQLEYLLKGYAIPYKKAAALSIEAYNIPLKKELNRYIYFKKIPLKNNKLEYILYSFYIILDKKAVDSYVKKYYPNSKNYILTYLKNLDKTPPKPKKLKPKPKKTKPKYHLILTRIHTMIDYGYIPQKVEINKTPLIDKIYDITSKIDDIKDKLETLKDKTIAFKLEEKISPAIEALEGLKDEVENLQDTITLPKCLFDKDNIKKECFKNPDYFHNYVYFKIKEFTLPSDEEIIAYGDYKTFNDVGIYYYSIGDFQKSEIFLNKAYVLAEDKTIPAHNLSVLYATYNPLYDIKKAIKYMQQSNLQVDYYNLGVYYYLGKGVKESDKIAREYFSKATEIPLAKENLEIMRKYKIGIK